MVGKLVTVAAVVAALLVGSAATASASSPVALVVPQGNAFGVLGHSCGGIQEQVFATGFDPITGYPVGDAYLSTRCGGSGRGGGYHTTTYSAWVSATWNYEATFVSLTTLTGAPSVDPAFVAYDAFGNEVYSASNSAFLVLSDTFVPPPTLSGISPTFGPSSGGTSVTITGTGFTTATDVLFGAASASSFVVNGDTSITAVAPAADGGIVDVTVVTAGGSTAPQAADEFTYYSPPTIAGLSPSSGPVSGGNQITITGTSFTGATGVSFGDAPAGFTVDSDTSITAWVPASDSGVDSTTVTVTTPGGTSPGVEYDYVNVAPQVSIDPPSGPSGTVATIEGSGFLAGERVSVKWTTGLKMPKSLALCATTADGSGSFSCVVTIPTTNAGAVGTHAVQAAGRTSLSKASTTFILTT
jgi:hypothetical protein